MEYSTNPLENMFDALARQADALANAKKAHEELPDKYIPPERIQEYLGEAELLLENIQELETDMETLKNEIKKAVLESGATYQRNGIKAVFVKGKELWNHKGLNNAMKANPWLAHFRSEGKPFIQIKGL